MMRNEAESASDSAVKEIGSESVESDEDINNHHGIPRDDWNKGHYQPARRSP